MAKRIICLLILLGAIQANGQKLLGIANYTNNSRVSKNAKDFYEKKFRAGDDAKTFSIIDSLKTKNDFTRPFYIYLVSTMLTHSDGALSEFLLPSCIDFIENSPNHLMEFLYTPNNKNKKYISDWARAIDNGFSLECDEEEKKCITTSMNKALQKTKTKNKKNLTRLYDRIRKYATSK